MTKVSRKALATVFAATLFLISTVSVPVVMAATPAKSAALAATPLTAMQANWAAADGNQFNQNYNPQNVINSSNAQYLGLKWLFPLPTLPPSLASVAYGAGTGLGVDTAPLIVNGTVYAITQYDQVFALDAATGNVLWTDLLPVLPNSTVGLGTSTVISLHLHDGDEQFTTALFNHTPTFWVVAANFKDYAINALTGAYELNFSIWSGVNGIAGNNPNAFAGTRPSNLLIDQNRGILISSIDSGSASNTGRCFYRGWNILVNPPQLMWTAFCTPPQVGSNIPVNPNWDIQQVNNMTGAEIFYPGPAYDGGGNIPGTAVVNLKTMSAAQLNSTLYNDWGYVQSAACTAADGGASPGSTASGWGAPWLLDEKTGIAYLNTNNRDPYTSACMPGPDLWSASVLALNDQTGQWVWGFQTAAHENWDYDCSWQQVLGNETVNGVQTEVLWKTCKNGYLYELNAANGNLIWAWEPPQSILARCPYCYMHNPLNSTEMTEAFFNPSLQDTLMYPSAAAGFENEFSYNPALNYIFTASQNVPGLEHYIPMNITNYGKNAGFSGIATAATAANLNNATIEAVNAATGQMVWSHLIASSSGYRGGLTTSGNLVFATLSSGDLVMLNAQTGNLVKDFFIGGPLNVLPSIGATASGQEEVIVPITAGEVTWGTAVPGDLVALTLQAVPPSSSVSISTTTTTASGSVSTTTSVSVSVSVSTVTATSGASNNTLYGIAAVAVIFIIATGYLAMTRGKKPAS